MRGVVRLIDEIRQVETGMDRGMQEGLVSSQPRRKPQGRSSIKLAN